MAWCWPIKKCLLLFLCLTFGSCGGLFYFPDSYLYSHPTKFSHDWEEVHFYSSDQTQLHGWLLKTKQAKPNGTIVFFHGNAQNLSSHFQSLEWLVSEGFDLFIFDYRGYGKSLGSPEKKGIYEDALAALKQGHQFYKDRSSASFIIYAQSLGGIISIPAVANFSAKNDINLYILEATFPSYQKIAFDKLYSIWWLLPFSPLAYLLVNDDFAAQEYLQDLPATNYLVIHGTDDTVVPYKFGKKLYELLPHETKRFLKVEGGHHMDTYFREGKRYREEYLPIILENLTKNRSNP